MKKITTFRFIGFLCRGIKKKRKANNKWKPRLKVLTEQTVQICDFQQEFSIAFGDAAFYSPFLMQYE